MIELAGDKIAVRERAGHKRADNKLSAYKNKRSEQTASISEQEYAQ